MSGIPKDPENLGDIEAAERYSQFSLGWFANPIFGTGDYPDIMKWQIGNKSLEQGLNESRLPEITDEERGLIKGILIPLCDEWSFFYRHRYQELLCSFISFFDKSPLIIIDRMTPDGIPSSKSRAKLFA